MFWVDLVTTLALMQFVAFGLFVAKARGTYGIKAPATTGDEMFERYYRVHMNTLEMLVVFVPALWMAAKYWSPGWMAFFGAIYLAGRVIYFQSYLKDPSSRTIGFAMSFLPTLFLLLAALTGCLFS